MIEEDLQECLSCHEKKRFIQTGPVPICDECKSLDDGRYTNLLNKIFKSRSRNRQAQKDSGYIYLIAAENGLYKIGKAKDLGKRLKPFSVNFPMRWELIHSFRSDDYSRAESRLHKRFTSKRDVGEWFRLSPSDIAFITSLQDGSL